MSTERSLWVYTPLCLTKVESRSETNGRVVLEYLDFFPAPPSAMLLRGRAQEKRWAGEREENQMSIGVSVGGNTYFFVTSHFELKGVEIFKVEDEVWNSGCS